MILLINICKEKLHYFEFVKPIEDILKTEKISFVTKDYAEVDPRALEKSDRVIICGTSLKDNEFMENMDKFCWIKDFDKPLLGICGGMQIIAKIFGGEFGKKTEIGFYKENFVNEFLGLTGEQEVYHLHNNSLGLPKDFEEFTNSKIPQAIKHRGKEIYGALFHPEVRQKQLIVNFSKL